MKLIIDVPEEIVKKGFEGSLTDEERMIIIRAVGNASSYEERPQGEWIISEYVDTRRGFITKCPFCKTDTIGGGNFCPNCGADMRKGGAVQNDHCF